MKRLNDANRSARGILIAMADKKITIYHGSKEIVAVPQVVQTKHNKDFATGFYCTFLEEQANRWAVRGDGHGFVNAYEYTRDSSLAIKQFPEMSEEWLDFIVACRSGKTHAFDIVEGPMADDQIYNYVQSFLDGDISREAFWALAKFKKPTHQISFHTNRALETIKFIAGKEVTDEE